MTEGHTDRLDAALDGKYRIERKLGEGGMASVYLAEDIKHERKVALKILRPELAAVLGAERFLSEIKTTANLQHPHILPLFDSGEAASYLYYVMPYVEGETLRDKLDREKQLGVTEAVRIARDVADALDYAHRHDVIHRDIKPANILLHDGRPVVADFGIALAVSAAGGGRMTETGLSLGTPHYMSPEQASADRDLSARSDVYSLGCVLYEMIAGQPPHTGPSAQSILVRILTESPRPLTELRHTVPPHVAATVAKAIEKLPADRFETAKEFMEALEDASFTYQPSPRTTATVAAQPAAAPAQRAWLTDPRSAAALVAGVGLAALAALGWLRPATEPPTADPVRFSFDAPLDFVGAYAELAISPDGQLIVYKAPNAEGTGPRLHLRALGELEDAPLRGGEGGVGPVVSPDGEWVAFLHYQSLSTLQRVSTLGGAPVTLVEAPSQIAGVSWGADDQIVFGTVGGGLYRIPAGGGEPEQLTALDTDERDSNHFLPSIIDGRDAVVFTISSGGNAPLTSGQLAVLDIESGDVTRLGVAGVNPRYVSTGHLVYAAEDGSVRAVPFDVRSLTVTGSTVPLVEGVTVKPTGAANFDVSNDGRLVYVLGQGGGGIERSLLWVDREGREEPVSAPARTYVYPRISPDGRRVAIDVRGETSDIWIWDFAAETSTRLILGDGGFTYPVWTPDGARIAYAVGSDIYWKASNNTGVPELLAEAPGVGGAGGPSPYFFTPDGAALVFRDQQTAETDDDLMMISVDDAAPVWHLNGTFRERNAVLSPDGRWMAYQSDESGQFEIYVRPFPQVDQDQVPVSNSGGLWPAWSRDGRELFYLQPGGGGFQLVSVSVEPDGPGGFAFSGRDVVMDWPYYSGSEGRNYDVSPDGRRFLAVQAVTATSAGDGASPRITVVLNWFTELRERMGDE